MVDGIREQDRAPLLVSDFLGDPVQPFLGQHPNRGKPGSVRIQSRQMSLGIMSRGCMCVGVPDFRHRKVLSGLKDVLDDPRWNGRHRRSQGIDQEVVRMETNPECPASKEKGNGDCTQGFEFTKTIWILLRRRFLG